MRVRVIFVSGEEAADIDAFPHWQLHDTLVAIPQQEGTERCKRRLFFGDVEFAGGATLAEIGVVDSASLTLVQTPQLLIATTSSDCTAKIWCSSSGECLHTLKHEHWVKTAVFSPSGQELLTASSDCTAKIWSASTGQCIHTLAGHRMWLRSAVYSPDGQQVLTAAEDARCKLWSTSTGECLRTLDVHNASERDQLHPVGFVAFSPSGKEALTSMIVPYFHHRFQRNMEKMAAQIYSTSSWERLHALDEHDDSLTSALFSPDGQQVLTASRDCTAKLWSVSSGKCLLTLEGHTRGVVCAAFSADGQRVLTTSDDLTAKLWSPSSGECLHTLEPDLGGVEYRNRFGAISPSGEEVLVRAMYCEFVELWSASTGQRLRLLEGHDQRVCFALFSPDGQEVLTGSNDGTAKLWSTSSGECLRTFEGHTSPLEAAAFQRA